MKPDRDEDPPDLYNSIRAVTNVYRAGMGLRPMNKVCPDCREVYESDLEHECPIEDTSDWPDDKRLDDPRRGQAQCINRERYKP